MGNRELRSSICVPSTIHAYSLGMEYIKNWFFSKFSNDYFKTIHIEQKHILDDFRNRDSIKNLKKLKPSVAIIPQINFEYNRDNIDLYSGGLDLFIKRHKLNDSFLYDSKKDIYLGMVMEQLETSYNFRIRLSTRAQQVDLYKYINLAFRVGSTQGQHIDVDFHIPYSLMLQIAKDAGFEINEQNQIVDIIDFVSYLNKHSFLPITYKLRTINGHNEFFVRCNELYVHLSCMDPLSADDGEKEGMLYSNYIIDFNVILKFPAPKMYVYYSKSGHEDIESLELNNNNIGLYNIKLPDYPEENEKGWQQYLTTSYCTDIKGRPAVIEFNELFKGSELEKVNNYLKSISVSPAAYIEFKIFENGKPAEFDIDWETYTIVTKNPIYHIMLDISIYVDLPYMKDRIFAIEDLKKKRIRK